jgi:hypothetical protein
VLSRFLTSVFEPAGMSKDEAMEKYIETVEALKKAQA